MTLILLLLLLATIVGVYGWNRCDLDYMRLLRKYEEDMQIMNDRCTQQSLDHIAASKRDVQLMQQLRVENTALKREMAGLMCKFRDPVITEIQKIEGRVGGIEPETQILLDLAKEAQLTGKMPDLSRLASHQRPISG